MTPLTIEGLVLGLLAGLLLPPALVASLRGRLGRGVALVAATVALTLLAAFVIGWVQDHPDAAVGALILAPGVTLLPVAFLWRDRAVVAVSLLAAGLLWLIAVAARLTGVA